MFCKTVHADDLDGYFPSPSPLTPPFKASLISTSLWFFENLVKYFWKKRYLT